MTVVKADIRLEGSRGSIEGELLVDTGASITVIDLEVAERLGIIHTGRMLTLITSSGHRVEGELAVVRRLIIDGEGLPYGHILTLKIPMEVKEMLRSRGLDSWGIIGLTTIELLNLTPDVATGRLKRAESFMLI